MDQQPVGAADGTDETTEFARPVRPDAVDAIVEPAAPADETTVFARLIEPNESNTFGRPDQAHEPDPTAGPGPEQGDNETPAGAGELAFPEGQYGARHRRPRAAVWRVPALVALLALVAVLVGGLLSGQIPVPVVGADPKPFAPGGIGTVDGNAPTPEPGQSGGPQGSASARPRVSGSPHPSGSGALSVTTSPPQSPAPSVTTPRPPPAPVRYEAESATIVMGVVANDHGGYSGSGFVDYQNVKGSYVQWSVPVVAAAGRATLRVRFANGTAVARPLTLTVNGVVVGQLAGSPTGDWAVWQVQSVTVALTAGSNMIRATATTDNGGPNIDYLEVQS